jgi:hypothetical protein
MLVRRVDRLFAVSLRAMEDMVTFLVALEAKSLFVVSFAFVRGKTSRDGVEINSASA